MSHSNSNTESGNSEGLGEMITADSNDEYFPITKVGEKVSDGISIIESQGQP